MTCEILVPQPEVRHVPPVVRAWILNHWIARKVTSILSCRFSPFISLNISRHSLLSCRVSAEQLADSLMGFPL